MIGATKCGDGRAVRSGAAIRPVLRAALWIGIAITFPSALIAQSIAASRTSVANSTPAAAVAFSEGDADSQRGNGVSAAPAVHVRADTHYDLPENECSASFWDPYIGDSFVASSEEQLQEKSATDIEPLARVQEHNAELVEPLERVQQLNSELVVPAIPLGGAGPPIADAPGDHPDNP